MSNQFEILNLLNQEAIRFDEASVMVLISVKTQGNRFCNELNTLCSQNVIQIHSYDTSNFVFFFTRLETDSEYGNYVQIQCIFSMIVDNRQRLLHGSISFSFTHFYNRPANIYFINTDGNFYIVNS